MSGKRQDSESGSAGALDPTGPAPGALIAESVAVVRGEFLDIDAKDLRPYDILGEGRVIQRIVWGWHGGLDVGPCHASVEVIELADGPRCLWSPSWGEMQREPIPTGTVRVFRGDLPGYFCTAEPEGPRDPCGSERCPIRGALTDGPEDGAS
ncbi:MAG: hypothetical protein ACRDQD_04155 [Nocardioidaceae bacterium]